ncbi:tyrosine-protein phosphatase 10D-like isoform X2 [Mizuhopecten yessoensis]|uniref:tyrosine-protein phosphatase 10D-like isoform X2 n=1 Tax=Mizuhopecten yessoensis TaxID=6573 RepID=UPI000B458466|nr:tyrosine-protein phosphatase 10D-like isoform X2 [Mizuhopecten yessoensis]
MLVVTVAVFLIQTLLIKAQIPAVNVTPGEYSLDLTWTESDGDVNFTVGYGLAGNISYKDVDRTLGSEVVMKTITDLQPGVTYQVNILRSGTSIYSANQTTKPLPPTSINVDEAGTENLYISWTPDPDSVQDSYRVFLTGITNFSEVYESELLTELFHNITGVYPGHVYTITVVSSSQGVSSNFSTLIEDNTVPLSPIIQSVVALDNSSVMMSWVTEIHSTQDHEMFTATYNTSFGQSEEVNLTCKVKLWSSCVASVPGIPGQMLLLEVFSVKGVRRSEPDSAYHSTKPDPLMDIVELGSSSTDLYLQLVPPTVSSYQLFLFKVIIDGLSFYNFTVPPTETNVTLNNLTGGTAYNISATVASQWEESTSFSDIFYTDPYPSGPIKITDAGITQNSIKVLWEAVSSGSVSYYEVRISPKEPQTISPVMDYTVDQRTALFEKLVAGKMYVVTVVSGAGQKRSNPTERVVWTRPYPPVNVTAVVRSGRVIDVTWQRPVDGMVENYFVTAKSTLSDSVSPVSVTVSTPGHSFTKLHPGETYDITVTSLSGNVSSSEVKVQATTNPTSVAELYIDFVGSSTVNVSWPRPDGTVIDMYELNISPADTTSPITLFEVQGQLHHSFEGLNPGTLYNISIQTFVNSSGSDEAEVAVITKPLPVKSLNVSSHASSSLYAQWQVPNTHQQSFFEVVYQTIYQMENASLPLIPDVEGQLDYSETLYNLSAGYMYQVSIRTIKTIGNLSAYSTWESASKTTKPKPVLTLMAVLIGRDVKLLWTPDPESTQDHYYVLYRGTITGANPSWDQTLSNNTELQVTGLFPGERYDMLVIAGSYGEMSPHRNVSVQIPPLAPTDLLINTSLTTESTLSLSWSYNRSATFIEEYKLDYQSYRSSFVQTMTIPHPNDTVEDLNLVLGNLTSGETYKITLKSSTNDAYSEEILRNATVQPECLTILSEEANATDTISVQYTDTSNYFDHYLFYLTNESGQSAIQKDRVDTDRKVAFTSLSGGTVYSVKVVSVAEDQISDPQYIYLQTVPNQPHVTQTATSSEITLTIHKPEGHVDSFMVVCFRDKDPCGIHSLAVTRDSHSVTFDNLLPFTMYNFQVVAIAGIKQNSVFPRITTNQAAPSYVRDLKAVESSPLTVNLTWRPPLVPNGIITAYLVAYTNQDGIGGSRNLTLAGSLQYQSVYYMNFTDLLAGHTYSFMVYAKTVTLGTPAVYNITLRTYPPPIIDAATSTPKGVTDKGIATVTPTTVIVHFTNPFSSKYGDIINYTVIVATDTTEQYTNAHATLPDWKAAQVDPSIKAYQAIANCSTFFEESSTCNGVFRLHKRSVTLDYKVFEIGTESNCYSKSYCNGPLQQQTKYYVKLRGYTEGGYTDTNYSKPFLTSMVVEEDNIGGIIGGVVAAILVIIIFIVVFIVFRRMRDRRSNMYKERHSQRLSMTPRSSLRKNRKSHPVSMANFSDHIISMSADSDFKYAEQFEDLKEIGRDQPCTAAELPENRGKNRFTNILPYDHSRVKLLPTDDEEGSDYINANYMPGFNSRREYIVTQGALPSTRDDFWRMIWEQNSRNIVMLTKCVEKGREKCDHYWPHGTDAMFYGDLQVAALNETKFPSWTITEFRLSLGDVSRQIRHFHFLAWPDFGVPDKPQTLIRFVKTVREKLNRECGPIVVHCSAGVGRSGTYIALDRMLQNIGEHGEVDIFQTVAEMRRERVWMVQTEQQYICIHQCVLCVVEGREDEHHVYENAAFSNAGYEAHDKDDEGINVEVP